MRRVAVVILPSLLAASAAFADPDALRPSSQTPSTSSPAPSATAPDARAPDDVGLLRGQKMPSTSLRTASGGAPDTVAAVADEQAPVRDHAVAPAHMVAATATDGDVEAELAARQMRHQQRAFDGCRAAALKRTPKATGSVTLALDIADRKVQNVRVTDDSAHDPAFAACVTGAAHKLTFSLAGAHIAWPVAIK